MDMFDDLLTSSSRSSVSPETLEMLGRKASQMYQTKGIPLNEAIKQVAADVPELGNEHIKRIVEFANTVTFQEMFQNGADKNVHFQVADPGVVMRDMKDGGSPAHDGKTMQGGQGDYKMAPDAGNKGELDGELGALFGQPEGMGTSPSEVEKNAHVHGGSHSLHANPIDDVYDTHLRLQATREKLAEAHERFDGLVKQATADLYQVVKHEVISPDGAGLGGVVSVFEKLASREIAMAALTPIIEKLASERIMLKDSLEKTAGRVLNPAHPLVSTITGLVKAAQEQVRAAEALEQVDSSLERTSTFLKNAGALTTGVKNALGGKGRVLNAVRQRASRK